MVDEKPLGNAKDLLLFRKFDHLPFLAFHSVDTFLKEQQILELRKVELLVPYKFIQSVCILLKFILYSEKMVPVDEYLPIMYDKHPNETWKAFYENRNLRQEIVTIGCISVA